MRENELWDVLIRDARLPKHEDTCDIASRGREIVAIDVHLAGNAARTIDAAGNLVTQSFTEPHFHLDKVLSRGRFGALDFEQAFARAHEVKKHFTVSDVEERASRALELAVAHGTGRLRAQIDVDYANAPQVLRRGGTGQGALQARNRHPARWRSRKKASSRTPRRRHCCGKRLRWVPRSLADCRSSSGPSRIGRPTCEPSSISPRTPGVIVDMHADYEDSPELKTLEMMADETLARGARRQGRRDSLQCVVDVRGRRSQAGHREGSSGPGCRLRFCRWPIFRCWGGSGRTPYNRGSSRIKELLDAGVNVAAGADNMVDIWYRFNRMDPVETGYITCLSGGMRTDEEVDDAFEMIHHQGSPLRGLRGTGGSCRFRRGPGRPFGLDHRGHLPQRPRPAPAPETGQGRRGRGGLVVVCAVNRLRRPVSPAGVSRRAGRARINGVCAAHRTP